MAVGLSGRSGIKARLRRRKATPQTSGLERELGLAPKIPKEPLMAKGKIVPEKEAITPKKRLRPLLGYI